MSNRKFNKVVLSLCAVGIGGAGYLIGNLIRSQPTKATIEVEPVTTAAGQAKNKQQTAKVNKTEPHSKQAADQGQAEKKTDKQKQAAKKQTPATKSDTQTSDNSENKHKPARQMPQQKQAPVTKPKRQLFLTGKKTKQQYSAETIKRANQIYKQQPELSFKACLKLARKDNNNG